MGIVKINLYKVVAERKLNAKGGQIRINNNVSIKEVEDLQFNIPGSAGLKFTFAFNCRYEPDLGSIDVEGQVFFTDTEDKIKAIRESWKKNKSVPNDIMERVVNAALHKGNIQAIKVSEEVSLPSPLPLPKVKTGTRKAKPKVKPAVAAK
ncbi:hypothetical protein CL619_05240 [archaeon]|nr:hypothetical protein [archaeon]|tara:strand:- start:783 stop:1232 length:450 start_codon:yes stop_codon:yes gene_type:complete